jgi:hypothetical protein
MNKAELRRQKILERGRERLVQIQKVNGNEPIDINKDIDSIGTVSLPDTLATDASIDDIIEKQALDQFTNAAISTPSAPSATKISPPSILSALTNTLPLLLTFLPTSKPTPLTLTHSSLIILTTSYCISTLSSPNALPIILLSVLYHSIIERKLSSLTLARKVVGGVVGDMWIVVGLVGMWVGVMRVMEGLGMNVGE